MIGAKKIYSTKKNKLAKTPTIPTTFDLDKSSLKKKLDKNVTLITEETLMAET